MSARALEELSRCVIALLLQEPFFGHLLSGVVRAASRDTPTAMVALQGGRVQLVVNPTFFLKTIRKKAERVAIVKHEALHLLFKHLLRREPRHNPQLYNIAADLVVNQLIGRPWSLPADAVTLETFPDLGLEPDQTVDGYYDRLAVLLQELNSVAGSDAQTSTPASAAALRRLLEARWHSDHSQWGAGDLDIASVELDRLMEQAWQRAGPRSWGTVPGVIRQLVEQAIARRKPQVDWKRTLRIFATSSRRTRVISTIKRRSRRFGTRPGIRIRSFQKLAVVVDTSGSVPPEEIELFFAEIHGMWRQGAEVTVIEADAAVQAVWPYRGRLPQGVHGRGGTVFDPAFQHLRDSRRERYDGCIYLTDGFAQAPTVRPPCRLLWVVTSGGNTGDHLRFGRVVQLPTG